jgi:hypothetical protein
MFMNTKQQRFVTSRFTRWHSTFLFVVSWNQNSAWWLYIIFLSPSRQMDRSLADNSNMHLYEGLPCLRRSADRLHLYEGLPCLRRSADRLSPRRSWLHPRPVRMGFVIYKVALGQDFCQLRLFSWPVLSHQRFVQCINPSQTVYNLRKWERR